MTTKPNDSLAARLSKLSEFVEKNSEVVFDPSHPYSTCVKFALARAFGFASVAAQAELSSAFFLVPALRAVTEDLILFRFLSKTGSVDERDMVIRNLMQMDVHKQVDYQHRFFSKFRPFQPVLSPQNTVDQELEKARVELADYWRQHGWPGFADKKPMPPVRELAQKSDPGLMEVVYDFIYRLASGEVHSTPRALLRLGWGTSQPPNSRRLSARFSTENLADYYLDVAQIYGTYILCLWFEFFSEQLDAGEHEGAAVAALRKYLLSRPRWPEMVTFEEMNFPAPGSAASRFPNFLIAAIYTVISEEGFVAGMNTILNANKTNPPEV